MEKDEILRTVSEQLIKSSFGQKTETPKLDFKRSWYDLKSKKGINSFLKDVTAIVNTVGLDGFIVIGWDEGDKSFYSAKFPDSGLKDSNEIQGIIAKNCSDIFDITVHEELYDGEHPISIIHIPPSFSKSVFMKNYQSFGKNGELKKEEAQRIWIRKGTNIYPATKADLELMYYDRKNIIQEEKIEFIGAAMIELSSQLTGIQVLIQNYGIRPVAITAAALELGEENRRIQIPTQAVYEISKGKYVNTKSASTIIDPNKSVERIFVYNSRFEGQKLFQIVRERKFPLVLYLRSSNKRIYNRELTITRHIGLKKTTPEML